MDTVEKVQKELEGCLGGINAGGPGAADVQLIEKLEQISVAAAGLGMNQGQKLIDNLSAALKSFKEGKAPEDSVKLRLTALDFYLQNTAGAAVEEL
jgi:hypothetical protein